MKLIVYKGFDNAFLASQENTPLLDSSIAEKRDVLHYDKKSNRVLRSAFFSLEDEETAWITYEEYTILRALINDEVENDGLEVEIIKNNVFPDCYPLCFDISPALATEIEMVTNGDSEKEDSDLSSECINYLKFYNSLYDIDGAYYGGFYNYEYDSDNVIVTDYYPVAEIVENHFGSIEYELFINDDLETYLRDISRVENARPSAIGVKTTNGEAAKRILGALAAYCSEKNIVLAKCEEPLNGEVVLESELAEIAKNDIGISGFSSFRKIKFYSKPDIDNEVVEISQARIIQDIIQQAEIAYSEKNDKRYRDIFITASTGAGKSVMFQIPAVYLAKKYKKLTIIIEPVKALMQDQKEKLNSCGYTRVETFNSDLITQVEKEQVLKRIKSGEVDLLYLSPETLLSYSIETIIGDREIGLLIVDEAHIVTTWGFGFRPDYWYLGGYINRLRNQIQTSRGVKRKAYNFPICAFTATAINGGKDDSVSDTIISLYMENPIKYIGYVKRDDISFDISCFNSREKMKKAEYERLKKEKLEKRINNWLNNNEKTIVYFPYASYASNAKKCVGPFSGMKTDSERIGLYTGKNTYDLGQEAFNSKKREVFEGFRTGKLPVVLATKAFGMGIDVDDVENVYHYAVTGNLSDYVQEIGRAARRTDMSGCAITDYYFNDLSFMKALFGMSQIKHYQIKKVLEEIYNTHKNKNYARSFLITPQSFSYIFNDDENNSINKLKTCLLMLEKDFYDKYNFKVLISRPQSVFTKTFVCIDKDHEKKVLNSKYGQNFKYICAGRDRDNRGEGKYVSDVGDIYSVDLKSIWENYHPNISFPQFKYWFFNANSKDPNSIRVMPTIRRYLYPRQKVVVEAHEGHTVSEVRDLLLEDFEKIADVLYSRFRNQYFSTTELVHVLSPLFGRRKANIIADSLFDIVDPDHKCVKKRINESTGKIDYSLSNGTLKELMRRSIVSSPLVKEKLAITNEPGWTGYDSLKSSSTERALKLMSIFDYVSYEVVGGEDPEIFIRLNDPNKVKDIVFGNLYYANNYVDKAKEKHDRDVEILLRFFTELNTDAERWDYIEKYFLGYDVLGVPVANIPVPKHLTTEVDKEHSYSTAHLDGWEEIRTLFEKEDQSIISRFEMAGIPIPEYLETNLKNSDAGDDIIMSWPSKDVVVCHNGASETTFNYFEERKWKAFRFNNVDFDCLKEVID